MAYALRTVTCRTCGHETTGRYPPNKPWRCLPCGIKVMAATATAQHEGTFEKLPEQVAAGREAARQIRERTGPIYDRWRAGMLSSVRGRRRVPPPRATPQD